MGGWPVGATADHQMQVDRVDSPSLGATDRQAPRSVPPFRSSVGPQIWMDGSSSAGTAIGDRSRLRLECAGQRSSTGKSSSMSAWNFRR